MHPLIDSHRQDLETLCARFHVRRLELFGSASRGEDQEGTSDVDFIVAFEELKPALHSKSYFGLKSSLEELFRRPVDLVEAAAIENPFFLKSIEPDRQIVYAG